MSCDPLYTVFCDVEGCLQWGGSGHNRKEARAEAKRLGWRRTRTMDVCPRHATPPAAVDQTGAE